MKKIKLGIADDHDGFRNSIVRLLNEQVDLEVILEARNGVSLLQKLRTTTPDIILMDIRMPEMNGLEATKKVVALNSNIKIIIHTQFDDEQSIIDMYASGVKSFLSKNEEPEELLKAIRVVYQGGAYMTNYVNEIIKAHLTPTSHMASIVSLTAVLSKTECLVLKYICEGWSSTDIGDIIHKSPRTVEKYREDLYRKLNVNRKKELIELGHNILYTNTPW